MVCSKDMGFILVRAECLYVQFVTARVIGTKFVVGGYKRSREGAGPKSLWVRMKLEYTTCAMMHFLWARWFDRSVDAPSGVPGLPFYKLREGHGV